MATGHYRRVCPVDGDAGHSAGERGAVNGSQSVEESPLFSLSPVPPCLGAAGALKQASVTASLLQPRSGP